MSTTPASSTCVHARRSLCALAPLSLMALLATPACTRSGFEPWPCDGQDCSGHGVCELSQEAEPICACEPGYTNAGPLACEPLLDSGVGPQVDSSVPDRQPQPEASVDVGVLDAAVVDVGATEAGAQDLAPLADAATPDHGSAADAATPDGLSAADVSVADSARPPDAAIADSPLVTLDASLPGDGATADCRIFHPVPLPASVISEEVEEIWGAAADDLRAVTASGSILHWDGCTVQTEHVFPSGLYAIWGFATDDIWAAGPGDRVLRYNGSTWSELVKPVASTIRDIWGSSADDVWLVGSLDADDFYALRWNSVDGFSEPNIRNINVTPRAMWGSGPDDLWFVGTYGIVRHNGNRFDQFEYNLIQDLMAASYTIYYDVWGVAPDDLDIGGYRWSWTSSGGSYYFRGGKRWNGVDLVSSLEVGSGRVYGVHGTGAADRWRVGTFGFTQRDQGAGWTSVTECGGAPPSLVAVHAFAPDDVWFAGLGGGLYHYCGPSSVDGDSDTFHAAICGGRDCDDCDPDVNPDATEGPQPAASCSDGKDNDCDGLVDAEDDGCA